MGSESSRPPHGLRERKKQKTRTLIQQHALKLFLVQGYTDTTVEQIAEAAEVSPRTFFRYFPTKEDVVVQDAYDDMFLAAVRAQPPELNPVQAVRRTVSAFVAMLPPEQIQLERERLLLVMRTPELRARMLGGYAQALRHVATNIAARTGRSHDDYAVRALAGAMLGVGLAAMVSAADDPATDYFALFDEGMARLEEGHLL